jgi:steroid 5-alpha reductase family enzyme
MIIKRNNVFSITSLILIIIVFLFLISWRVFCEFSLFAVLWCFAIVAFALLQFSVFIAVAYDSTSVFILIVLLSMRLSFVFMFINSCRMSSSSTKNKDSSWSTTRNNRKNVESFIVFENFSFNNLFMSFCIWVLQFCKNIRDAVKSVLETSSRRSIDIDIVDTRSHWQW